MALEGPRKTARGDAGAARIEQLQELVRRDPLLSAQERAELMLAIEEPSRFAGSPSLQAMLGEVAGRGRGVDASRFVAEAAEYLGLRAKILRPLSLPPALSEVVLTEDIHLRPAVALVQLAREFPGAKLSLQCKGEQLLLELNAISAIDLAALQILKGERIALIASGPEAQTALDRAREILAGARPEVRVRHEEGESILRALLFDQTLVHALHRELQGAGERFAAQSRAGFLDLDGGLVILGNDDRVSHAQIDEALGLSQFAGERLIAVVNFLNETVEGSIKIEVPRLHPRNAFGDERWARIRGSVSEIFEPYARFVRRQEDLLVMEFSENLRPAGEGPIILDLTPGRPSFAGEEFDYRLELTALRAFRARNRQRLQQFARSIMPLTRMALHTDAGGLMELGRRSFSPQLQASERFTLLATGPDSRMALRAASSILSAAVAARAAYRITSR